jgi:hypothetical protein
VADGDGLSLVGEAERVAVELADGETVSMALGDMAGVRDDVAELVPTGEGVCDGLLVVDAVVPEEVAPGVVGEPVTVALAAAWRASSEDARAGGFSNKTNNPTATIRAVE